MLQDNGLNYDNPLKANNINNFLISSAPITTFNNKIN